MKEQGSNQYKTLVYKPFEIGKKIILPRDQYLSEGLYICGRSFLINRRPNRALRYIKKAIKFSMSPPAEYFLALGDAQFSLAKQEESQNSFENDYYLTAKKQYEEILNMKISNNVKGKVYYKLGVLHLYFNEKKEAKQAFDSALKFAEKDSLISKIRSKIGTL
jgi:tetratricopeptide (TPR) repeat protein